MGDEIIARFNCRSLFLTKANRFKEQLTGFDSTEMVVSMQRKCAAGLDRHDLVMCMGHQHVLKAR